MCITLCVVIVTYTIKITNRTDEDGVFQYGEVHREYKLKPLTIKNSGGNETIEVLYNKKVLFIIKLQAEGDYDHVLGTFTIIINGENLQFNFRYEKDQTAAFDVPSSRNYKFDPASPVPTVVNSRASVSFEIWKQ